MNTPIEDPWPFHYYLDVEPDSVCSKCLQPCAEENLEAIVDVMGTQHFACPECLIELENDFKP